MLTRSRALTRFTTQSTSCLYLSRGHRPLYRVDHLSTAVPIRRLFSTQIPPPPVFAPAKSRLWYNKYGKRRFTWGVGLLSLYSVIASILTYELVSLIEDLEHSNYLLSSLIDIQLVDSHFATVDMQDPQQVLIHFRRLCGSFSELPKQMIDDFFDDVAELPGDEAIIVARNLCLRVHDLLAFGDDEPRSRLKHGAFSSDEFPEMDLRKVAIELLDAIEQSLVQLIEMVDSAITDKETLIRSVKIREQLAKDSVAKDKSSHEEKSSYEEVG